METGGTTSELLESKCTRARQMTIPQNVHQTGVQIVLLTNKNELTYLTFSRRSLCSRVV